MTQPAVHGSPQFSRQNAQEQSEPDALVTAIEQGFDTEPAVSPVQVTGVTRTRTASTATYRTLSLTTAQPYLMVLPQDEHRSRAVLAAPAGTVYLCENQELAAAVAAGSTQFGFTLGTQPVELANRWETWAAVSGAPGTVSVLIERHADLEPGG